MEQQVLETAVGQEEAVWSDIRAVECYLYTRTWEAHKEMDKVSTRSLGVCPVSPSHECLISQFSFQASERTEVCEGSPGSLCCNLHLGWTRHAT